MLMELIEVQPNIRWEATGTYYHEELVSHAEDSGYSNNLASRAKSCLDRALRRFILPDGQPNIVKLPPFSPNVRIRVVFEIVQDEDQRVQAIDAEIKEANKDIVAEPVVTAPEAQLTKEEALAMNARDIQGANKDKLREVVVALGGSWAEEDTNSMLKEKIKLLKGE